MQEENEISSYAEGQDLQKQTLNNETPEASLTSEDNVVENNKLFQFEENHNNILETLDIAKKEKTQDIDNLQKNENSKVDNPKMSLKQDIQSKLKENFEKIEIFTKAGLINSEQGQNLKKEVLKKAFDKLVQAEKIKRAEQKTQQETPIQNLNNGFNEFHQNNPDFFTQDGRKEVLNYLKQTNANLGKDDINKISDIVRTLEKSAIERYLQKAAHEKNLQNSNENAKQKLKANAQNSNCNSNSSRTFTREQIGKMSSAEFIKNEPFIMAQLKKGLIK